MANDRTNPFTGAVNWTPIANEIRDIALDPDKGIYGFYLDERPQVGTLVVRDITSGAATGAGLSVINSGTPGSGQCRPDTAGGTGFVWCNVSDNGKNLECDYSGGGTAGHERSLEALAGAGGVAPTGSILTFPTDSLPTGYLGCDGAAVSRTTYADLFTEIGTLYGLGDGSTTFNLPDYSGVFLRGWDQASGVDPDAASRTDSSQGIGGGDTGDNVGTRQADELTSHTHGYTRSQLFDESNGGAGTSSRIQLDTTTDATGGNETRPINVYVYFAIKT